MARTIQEIQELIYQAKTQEPALNELNSTSKVAIWRLWVYIIAVAIWSLEKIFDLHRADIDKRLAELKPGTAKWYHSKALAFQYGFDLLPDSDKFNNHGRTEEQIEASKVVKYCAVTDAPTESRIVIKIATDNAGTLTPVTTHQQEAFSRYINEIKYAGVYVTILNNQPDWLKLSIRIVRNPLILNENGMNVNSGKQTVKEAIKDYLKRLSFNGELSLQALTDVIQGVEGVKDVSIDLAQTKWIEGSIWGNFQEINISRIPESGYFAVNFDTNNDTKSTITYL